MLVDREQLSTYNIPADLWFSRRHGSGSPISRDQYFITYSDQLVTGAYCAIGNDENGWELEQYNGVNWVVASINSAYSLIITNDGLKALTDSEHGMYKLKFSGIKIINTLVVNPVVPIINWTDTNLLQAGEVVFSCGTKGAKHNADDLKKILKWRFNNSNGGLQYILSLNPEGSLAQSDNGADDWDIGTIGLYVQDPKNNNSDVLFGVACLQSLLRKYATTTDRIGNSVKLNFNTVLTNIGYVSDLTVIDSGEQNIPEVPNESLLLNPSDPQMLPYNCYLIDNLYGTGKPALAVPKANGDEIDWVYFEPSQSSIIIDSDKFAPDVTNYMFVYWDASSNLFRPAEGVYNADKLNNPNLVNAKMPMGLRIGNSLVFAGDITNYSDSYSYTCDLANSGENYAIDEELLLVTDDSLTFRIQVQSTLANGAIDTFKFLGPATGNVDLFHGSTTINQVILPAIYDPRAKYEGYGEGARFTITQNKIANSNWDFPASWLNKPLYCDKGTNAGKATLTITDSFLGWCMGTNTIRLALDLRNRATETNYGTTRYSTNSEVADSITNAAGAQQSAVTPKTLKDNYFQITKTSNNNQAGNTARNPINVETYVRFDKTVLGKGVSYPVTSDLTQSEVAFYGLAYRAEWADLAEFYESDSLYEPGTLIAFGRGKKEISIAIDECNGVISTKPGYQLGSKKTDLHLPVALVGRVPVLMDGFTMPKFGDKIYLSKLKKGCASTVENGKCLGKIIEKDFGTSKLVECVIRIEF